MVPIVPRSPPFAPRCTASSRNRTSALRFPCITSRSESSAASKQAVPPHPRSFAFSTIWANRGCSGSRAMLLPCGVISPFGAIAPSWASNPRDWANAAAGGESEPLKFFGVAHAPFGKLQRQRKKVGLQNFWRCVGKKRGIVGKGPKAEAMPGAKPSGTPTPLVRSGAGHGDGFQPGHPVAW
ncbi:MAG: hypothetical protein UZ07_CHB004002305 [Chlorobi bacterium OLB7]|nr:MAG: hypothetical protein UZ07_CHB004002305 [Chlorobi bacterium OLB7]